MNLLECNNLTKKYGSNVALDDISFTIPKGKIIGLLGMNGSGKTTLIKVINQLLVPDNGEILFKGKKIDANLKNDIAYLPDKNYLDENMKAKEVISFFSDFYKGFDIKKAYKYLKEFDIDKDLIVYKMSKGMKEKLQLVLVMSRKASLYIIDEPLMGVDPITREYILDTILKRLDKNSSVIITTHLINEIEKVLDQVIILDKGKIVVNEEVKKLDTSLKNVLRRYSNVKKTD